MALCCWANLTLPRRRVSLPGTYQTLNGTIVTGSVSITGWQGIILLGQSSSAPPPAAPISSGVTRYLKLHYAKLCL